MHNLTLQRDAVACALLCALFATSSARASLQLPTAAGASSLYTISETCTSSPLRDTAVLFVSDLGPSSNMASNFEVNTTGGGSLVAMANGRTILQLLTVKWIRRPRKASHALHLSFCLLRPPRVSALA